MAITRGLFQNQISRPNFLLNGNFDFWQRGTAFTGRSADSHVADRFVLEIPAIGGTIDVNRSTTVPSIAENAILSTYSLQLDVNTIDASIAATDFVGIEQRIEGLNAAPMYGKYLTLSFWMRSALIGTYCAYFQNAARDKSHVVEFTIDVADTWEKKEITIEHDSSGTWPVGNAVGMIIGIAFAAGSNYQGVADTWNSADDRATSNQVNFMATNTNMAYISQMKLEIGKFASRFESGNYGDELTKIQRYYEVIGDSISSGEGAPIASGGAVSATSARLMMPYTVSKRTTPSVTFTTIVTSTWRITTAVGNAINATAISASFIGLHSARVIVTVASGLVAGDATILIPNDSGVVSRIDSEFAL